MRTAKVTRHLLVIGLFCIQVCHASSLNLIKTATIGGIVVIDGITNKHVDQFKLVFQDIYGRHTIKPKGLYRLAEGTTCTLFYKKRAYEVYGIYYVFNSPYSVDLTFRVYPDRTDFCETYPEANGEIYEGGHFSPHSVNQECNSLVVTNTPE